MIRVLLPSQLDDYTGGVRELTLALEPSADRPLLLADVIDALEKRYRGVAFRVVDEQGRIRRHIAMFVGESMVRTLQTPLAADDRVQIVGALSGG